MILVGNEVIQAASFSLFTSPFLLSEAYQTLQARNAIESGSLSDLLMEGQVAGGSESLPLLETFTGNSFAQLLDSLLAITSVQMSNIVPVMLSLDQLLLFSQLSILASVNASLPTPLLTFIGVNQELFFLDAIQSTSQIERNSASFTQELLFLLINMSELIFQQTNELLPFSAQIIGEQITDSFDLLSLSEQSNIAYMPLLTNVSPVIEQSQFLLSLFSLELLTPSELFMAGLQAQKDETAAMSINILVQAGIAPLELMSMQQHLLSDLNSQRQDQLFLVDQHVPQTNLNVDSQLASNSAMIMNGLSMFLPPGKASSFVSPVENWYQAEILPLADMLSSQLSTVVFLNTTSLLLRTRDSKLILVARDGILHLRGR